jgi:hypothetical protein
MANADKVDETFGGLVDGMDEIAGLAIPYARLPARARIAYSKDCKRWSDIADQSLESLLRRPKVGRVTVDALLAAATDAVAGLRAAAIRPHVGADKSIRQLLKTLDSRDRKLMSLRTWAQQPQSQRAVAEQLGVHSRWVERNQPRAEACLAELLSDPTHHEINEHASALRDRLGTYVPQDVVAAELRRLGVKPGSETAHVLLHLAGPYVRRGEWFENTARSGQQRAAAAIDRVLDKTPAASTASLTKALTAAGVQGAIATRYFASRADLRAFEGRWVRWGDSLADHAEAVLHASGAPATPEDILAAIRPDAATVRGLREALYAESRFVRASRRTWGLRAWEITEYSSVFDAIGDRIDAAGGTIDVRQLIDDILATFPDVAENSIRTYLGTLSFITEDGTVRRRTDRDALPPIPPLNTVPGAFRNAHNEIRLAVSVTSDVQRGSGIHIRAAVAAAIGLRPGQRQVFTGPRGELPVAWRLSSPNGPDIGSLRAAALAAGAHLGDTLVLIFQPDQKALAIVRIDSKVTGLPRLRQLLGRGVRTPSAALAASLKCPRADVATVLRARGDHDLANLVEREDLHPPRSATLNRTKHV